MIGQVNSYNPSESNEAFARQVFAGHIRAIAFGELSDGNNTFDLSQEGEPAPVDAFASMAKEEGESQDRVETGSDHTEASLNHLQTQALLCSALARLFSYPSVQNAADFSNEESLEYLQYLINQAGLLCTESKPLLPAAHDFASEPDSVRAALIRAEYTRLFFQCQAPIKLEGHCWLAVSERTEEAQLLGEAAAVNAFYRRYGMKVKRGFAADNLSTELDFLARLTRLEEESRQQGEASEASTWKQARLMFLRQHLAPFALRACAAIQAADAGPLLRYEAALLTEVIEYCS